MFLDVEGIVGEEQDVALMQQPEEVGGVFGGWGGAAFGQDGLPEAFELGGLVGADPLDHDAGALGEDRIGRQRVRAGGAGEELALALEDRQVFGFDGAAHRRDQHRGMVAGVVAGEFEGGEQGGRQVG